MVCSACFPSYGLQDLKDAGTHVRFSAWIPGNGQIRFEAKTPIRQTSVRNMRLRVDLVSRVHPIERP